MLCFDLRPDRLPRSLSFDLLWVLISRGGARTCNRRANLSAEFPYLLKRHWMEGISWIKIKRFAYISVSKSALISLRIISERNNIAKYVLKQIKVRYLFRHSESRTGREFTSYGKFSAVREEKSRFWAWNGHPLRYKAQINKQRGCVSCSTLQYPAELRGTLLSGILSWRTSVP